MDLSLEDTERLVQRKKLSEIKARLNHRLDMQGYVHGIPVDPLEEFKRIEDIREEYRIKKNFAPLLKNIENLGNEIRELTEEIKERKYAHQSPLEAAAEMSRDILYRFPR